LLTGCVFSSPLSSLNPAHFTDVNQNFFGTTTASNGIRHISTGDCPVSTPTRTPLPTATTSRSCKLYRGVFKERLIDSGSSTCVLIENAFFANLGGSGHGGAIRVEGNAGPLLVRAVTFKDCTANYYGGGIFLALSFIEVDRCCFVRTLAGGSGN
jgi:hypothetical protein